MSGVLNLERGFVFVHVPKCAGSSMARALMDLSGSRAFEDLEGLADIVREENAQSRETVKLVGHARARDVQALLGAKEFGELSSMAVVRDPWERFISTYRYLRGKFLKQGAAPPAHIALPFSEYVVWCCAHRPMTMSERLCARDGALIVKDILRHEDLAREFDVWSRRVIGAALDLPKDNVSKSSSGPLAFDARAILAVQERYAEDFALFGYAAEPPSPLRAA